MNLLLSYFWPPFAAALAVGVIAGIIAFRRRERRTVALTVGALVALAAAALWHGPLGAADRFASVVERNARATLDFYEMSEITARLHRDPLTRHLVLSGKADDFQSNELVRTMDTLPGISGAGWSAAGGGPPLIVEGGAVAVLGFLLGLLLAYLVELRRRYNAQWNW
jgi:hypothetical protein